jgi:hypothetical protein
MESKPAPKTDADIEKQLEQIEKFITHKTAKEAVNSLSEEEKIKFLSDYYLTENLNYDEVVNKKTEENLLVLDKELEKGSTPPYSPELMEAMLNICKMSIIDQMVDNVSGVHQTLRDKLKGLKITDFKATMTYQLGMGNIAMKYNQLIAEEIQNECKSRGLNLEAFMQQAIPALSNDFSVFFEIDGFVGLKNYENVKNNTVELTKIVDYSKRTIEYTNLLLEQKIPPQSIMVYPSLMNQFLFMEFEIDNYQAMAKICEVLKSDNKKNYISFFDQILEEIWYVERGRGLIFMIFRQQMEMMEQMMNGGFDPAMLGGMDPGMMGGFDPAMLGGMPEGGMPGMQGPPMGMPPGMEGMPMPDMEALQAAMQNMDLSKLEEMFPGMGVMMDAVNKNAKKD